MSNQSDIAPPLEPIVADEADFPALKQLESLLDRFGSAAMLTSLDGAPVELSPALFRALKKVTDILLQGDAVVISPVHRQLTTPEAADLLNVPRQYLAQILDRGDLPSHLIGRHRRVALGDLVVYKRKRDAERREAVRKLTRQSDELGAYD